MSEIDPSEVIETFVRQVKATRKYHDICEDTVRDVIVHTLPKYRRVTDAARMARTTLHRIQAAYLGKHTIPESLDAIRAACEAGDEERLRGICVDLMREHASTRERLGLLDHFYDRIFEITGTPSVILDVACGVHPLAIPWMNLPVDTVFHAYEITGGLVDGLNGFLAAMGMAPLVKLQDVICAPPQETGDMAFLMKMVPCLERRRKGIAIELLADLRVRYVVVTFPVRSLAGRSKHMPAFYSRSFAEMVSGYDWQLIRVPIEGELVFVVDKGPAG